MSKPMNKHAHRQLTLFPQPKPTDEHRWPRGYTPERMAEVMDAMGSERGPKRPQGAPGLSRDPEGNWIPIPGSNTGRAVEVREIPTRLPDEPQVHPWDAVPDLSLEEYIARGGTPWSPGSPTSIRQIARMRYAGRQIAETIARSTVPVSDLGGGTVADPIPDMERELLPLRGGSIRIGRTTSPTALGHYERNDRRNSKGEIAPLIALTETIPQTSEEAARTLLHEVGHHTSALSSTDHSWAIYNGVHTPAAAGQEEGWADDYMRTHYRPDPRSREDYDSTHLRVYPPSAYGYEMGTDDAKEFSEQWRERSGFNALREQRDQQEALTGVDTAAMHAQKDHGYQQRLFGRHDVPVHVANRVADHGQFGWDNLVTGEPLDSIRSAGGPPQRIVEQTAAAQENYDQWRSWLRHGEGPDPSLPQGNGEEIRREQDRALGRRHLEGLRRMGYPGMRPPS
jgi:hypothetical protein